MPDPFDLYLSSPAVVKDVVYFGSGDGNVYALDAATGAVNWKFHTGDVVHASPAIANGTLFVGSWDSYFYALDAATGKEKWRFKTGVDPAIFNSGRHPILRRGRERRSSISAAGIRKFYALDAATGGEALGASTTRARG